MKFSELLALIQNIATGHNISTPFVCGGVPRDRILKRINNLNDVDLTTGDSTIHSLAKEVFMQLRSPVVNYTLMPDHHARITIGDFKLDFSSNFIVPQIEKLLATRNILNPTSMEQEVFSRDFTCNALLMGLNLKTIQDPTGRGLKDIENKKLITCLPPEITLGLDNKRVVRILYLAAKLNFTVDEEVINWVKKHPQSLSNVKPKYLANKLQKALNYNTELTLHLLDRMNLWHNVPSLPALSSYMSTNINRI